MNRRTGLVLIAALLAGCRITPDAQSAPRLRGLDGSQSGLPRIQGPRGLLLVFVSVDCPIANRFLPELEEIGGRATAAGLPLVYVYASPFETDGAVSEHHRSYRLRHPPYRDPGFQVAQALGASLTPEAVLLRSDGSIAYRGRVNDQYSAPGQGRPSPARHDLAEAVAAHLEGGWSGVRGLPAVGCRFRD